MLTDLLRRKGSVFDIGIRVLDQSASDHDLTTVLELGFVGQPPWCCEALASSVPHEPRDLICRFLLQSGNHVAVGVEC